MQYEIKIASCRALIDTRGAELLSFKADKIEYIWQRDERYWTDSAPILFPNVCDLRKDKTIIEGQEYRIPRHGFLHDMEFSVEDVQPQSLVLKASHTEETRKMFPYAFAVHIVYKIRDQELEIEFHVRNMERKTMYYQIGFHPGFCCPFEQNEEFEDYRLQFQRKETTFTPLLNDAMREIESKTRNFEMKDTDRIDLKYSYFDRDVLVFDKIQSRKVSLLNKNGRGISIAFPDFEMLGIWTPAGKRAPFLCLEPWNGTYVYDYESDDFVRMRGIQKLLESEEKRYCVILRIEK